MCDVIVLFYISLCSWPNINALFTVVDRERCYISGVGHWNQKSGHLYSTVWIELIYFIGTAVAQWLRCCATNQKVAGSIFHWHKILPIALCLSLLTEMSTRSISWGKGGRCVRLTTLPPSCAVVMKSGNLNLLEPSGPLQAYNGTAFTFTFRVLELMDRGAPNGRGVAAPKSKFKKLRFCRHDYMSYWNRLMTNTAKLGKIRIRWLDFMV